MYYSLFKTKTKDNWFLQQHRHCISISSIYQRPHVQKKGMHRRVSSTFTLNVQNIVMSTDTQGSETCVVGREVNVLNYCVVL